MRRVSVAASWVVHLRKADRGRNETAVLETPAGSDLLISLGASPGEDKLLFSAKWLRNV
jgi:hypothetical protein